MSFIERHGAALHKFQKKLFNSRFFTVSVLIHTIIVFVFGTTALFQAYKEPDDFTGGDGNQLVQADPNQIPPPPEKKPQVVQPNIQPTTSGPKVDAITTTAQNNVQFNLPQMVAPQVAPTADTGNRIASATPPPAAGMKLTAAQIKDIKAFTGGWAKGPGGPGSNIKQREFEFVAYLAKYGDALDPNRGGDWASTNQIKDGEIVKGSLPNLLYLMNNMSKDRIKASPIAQPLSLSSDAIFSKKPPFIFFTGHRDFVLTEKEVMNLRKYVSLGGCIWGDSSLPGRRSRFDLAFRREMRRVIPDKDKDWEVLPPTHPLYTSPKNVYYPEIKEPPSGVNFYKEPVYALKFADEVAVIYTANDYGDMWQIALDEKGALDFSRDENNAYIAMNDSMWNRREYYFRGLTLQTVMNSYKFGTNLVIHLITRWEDRLRNLSGL